MTPNTNVQTTPLAAWRNAECALVSLQDAPNRGIAGTLTKEATARVNKFLRTDKVLKELKLSLYESASSDGTPDQLSNYAKNKRVREFGAAVERAITIYEKLAKRNPSIELPFADPSEARFAHRLIALKLYSERIGTLKVEGERAPFGSSRFERTAFQKCVDQEDRVFGELYSLGEGNLKSMLRHYFLERTLTAATFPYVNELLQDSCFVQSGVEAQLKALRILVDELRSLGDGSKLSLLPAAGLYERVMALNRHLGLESIDNPLAQLVKEGLIGNTLGNTLQLNGQRMCQVDPVSKEIIKSLKNSSELTLAHLTTIEKSVALLKTAGLSESEMSSFAHSCCQGHMDRLGHFENCATLKSEGVRVESLLDGGATEIQIAADAAVGEYTEMGVKATNYSDELSARIAFELKLAKDTPAAFREMFLESMQLLGKDSHFQRTIFGQTLYELGIMLPETERGNRFTDLSQDLFALFKHGCDIAPFPELFQEPPQDVGQLQLYDFIANIASLKRAKVDGYLKLVDQLMANASACKSRSNRRNLDAFTETLFRADSAVALQKNGYALEKVCADAHSAGTFDIVGKDTSGESLAIQTIRRPSLLFDEARPLGTPSETALHRLRQLITSAQAEGMVPTLAIDLGHHDRIASTGRAQSFIEEKFSNFLDTIAQHLGQSPLVIRGGNGEVLFEQRFRPVASSRS